MTGLPALLLDLDGVLVDTETAILQVLTETFQDNGAVVTSEYVASAFRGRNLDMCHEELRTILDRPLPATFVADVRRKAIARRNLSPEPGARALLMYATPWRIVTNSACDHAVRTLRMAGLGDVVGVEDIIAVDQVECPKPAPDLHLMALADLNVSPSSCLAIEDSLTGIEAATAAGVQVVGYAPDDGRRDELIKAGHPTIARLTDVEALSY